MKETACYLRVARIPIRNRKQEHQHNEHQSVTRSLPPSAEAGAPSGRSFHDEVASAAAFALVRSRPRFSVGGARPLVRVSTLTEAGERAHLEADRACLLCAHERALSSVQQPAQQTTRRTSLYLPVVSQVARLISGRKLATASGDHSSYRQTMEGKRGGLICAALLAAIAYICSLV